MGPGLGYFLGGIGGSLLGGLFGNSAQAAANRTNIQLQQKQLDWEERMANSAYQRATTDMKAAGINPMLAVSQGGATTPSVAPARVEPVDAFAKGVASAADKLMQYNAIRKMGADADYATEKATQEGILTADMKAKYLDPTNPNNYTNMDIEAKANALKISREQAAQAEEATKQLRAQTTIREIEKRVQESTEGYQVSSARDRARILEKEVDITEFRRILTRLEIPEQQAIAKWFEAVGAGSQATKAIMSIGQWIKFIMSK